MRSPLLAILAVLGLACAALFGFVPRTASGVQCPTATVQTVAVRDCCGRLVVRAPKPGEREFVQCRCAEKRGVSHLATLDAKVHLFFEEAVATLEIPETPSEVQKPFWPSAPFASFVAAPPTPPPSLS